MCRSSAGTVNGSEAKPMVAAAVVGGSAISGIGSLVGGSTAASGAQAAAQTEAQAQQAATQAELQMQQNAIAQEQLGFSEAQAYQNPFWDTGLGNYLGLSKEVGAGALGAQPSLTDITQLPGYSFTLDQGLKATQNAAAAQGLGVSGSALKGASTYAENLANTYYNNYLQNYWTNQNNRYNQLYNLVQTGQAAAGQTATAATASGAQQANAITQTAAGQAQAQQNAANLQAGGILGAGTSVNNALL